MSAQDLRSETRRRAAMLENQHAAELIEGVELSHPQLNYRQGVVAGLRLAMDAMDEAYRAIGE